MEPIIEVENYLDGQCMRHLHLMSNIEFDETCLRKYGAVNGLAIREAGVWHLRTIHPYRGVIDIPAACVQGRFRRLVAWSVFGYNSMRQALFDARKEYCALFGGEPQFAFVRKLPATVEHGSTVGAMTLLETTWMLERCVAVGCKG